MIKFLTILLLFPILLFSQSKSQLVKQPMLNVDVKCIINNKASHLKGTSRSANGFSDTHFWVISSEAGEPVGEIQVVESYNLYYLKVSAKWADTDDQYVVFKDSFRQHEYLRNKSTAEPVLVFKDENLQLFIMYNKLYIVKASLDTAEEGVRCYFYFPVFGQSIPEWSLKFQNP